MVEGVDDLQPLLGFLECFAFRGCCLTPLVSSAHALSFGSARDQQQAHSEQHGEPGRGEPGEPGGLLGLDRNGDRPRLLDSDERPWSPVHRALGLLHRLGLGLGLDHRRSRRIYKQERCHRDRTCDDDNPEHPEPPGRATQSSPDARRSRAHGLPGPLSPAGIAHGHDSDLIFAGVLGLLGTSPGRLGLGFEVLTKQSIDLAPLLLVRREQRGERGAELRAAVVGACAEKALRREVVARAEPHHGSVDGSKEGSDRTESAPLHDTLSRPVPAAPDLRGA